MLWGCFVCWFRSPRGTRPFGWGCSRGGAAGARPPPLLDSRASPSSLSALPPRYLLVNLAGAPRHETVLLNAILALGAVFTLLDTAFSIRGKVFLARYPLSVSGMEALFIGLLCYFHDGLDSPFRYYYFLSLICCA